MRKFFKLNYHIPGLEKVAFLPERIVIVTTITDSEAPFGRCCPSVGFPLTSGFKLAFPLYWWVNKGSMIE